MNISGMVRGYMSKNMNSEKFMITVVESIEKQLKDWDQEYEVLLLKLKNYEIIVKKKDYSYHVSLSDDELSSLQLKSPFSLDRKIWNELQSLGIEIIKGHSKYIDYVFLGKLKNN